MILTAHQPVYLPWKGLLDKISCCDVFVSYDTVQYETESFQNRNRVMTHQGPRWLAVPALNRGHMSGQIKDVQIDTRWPWRRKHWETIRQSYSRAPFFSEYGPFLEKVYQQSWTYLWALNDAILGWLLDVYGIKVTWLRASDHQFQGSKSELALDMCRQLGATRLIFGEEGRDYADLEAFQQAGVEAEFHSYPHDENTLSAIHHLFTEGPVL